MPITMMAEMNTMRFDGRKMDDRLLRARFENAMLTIETATRKISERRSFSEADILRVVRRRWGGDQAATGQKQELLAKHPELGAALELRWQGL